MITRFVKILFGPELIRIYKQNQLQGRKYFPNNLEFLSNTFISFFHGFCVLCKWTSPVILVFAYYRGYFNFDTLYSLYNFAVIYGGFVACAYVLKAIGRARNPDYREFITKYNAINKNNIENLNERREFLSRYDFKMTNWAPDFISPSLPPQYKYQVHKLYNSSALNSVKFLIWRLLSKICVSTFGLRLMYPGVILQNLLGPALVDGRAKFIENIRARRALIKTSKLSTSSNQIDTLFVDMRNVIRSGATGLNKFAMLDEQANSKTRSSDDTVGNRGNYLVICCDGNASFYEVGIFQVPIEAGYSTLGWNYPGFGESTGLPYPDQVTAAADAVMQYGLSLGFPIENIILFSWSIGGFAVSWLSNHYPNVKAVVLDACFDDITHLARQQMPQFASNFVDYTIKHRLNLCVADYISKYSGPLLFIRRTDDEIISTIPRVAATNRGNDLLITTLSNRYPYIVDEETIPYIRTWLSAKQEQDRMRIASSYASGDEQSKCVMRLADYVQRNSSQYPIELGKPSDDETNEKLSRDTKLALAMYLADKYLINFESSHCQPLPASYFVLPWTEAELSRRKTYSF